MEIQRKLDLVDWHVSREIQNLSLNGKILHFDKQGISLNTFKERTMFLEMQDNNFSDRFRISALFLKEFVVSLSNFTDAELIPLISYLFS